MTTPRRTAIEDANANRVDVPSTRQTVRAQGIAAERVAEPDVSSQLELAGAFRSLGTKMQEYAAKKNETERQASRIQGAMDQGNDQAITDIAEVEKRTGMSEFIYGQSAYYEGAQRRAIQNNITSWATEELYNMESNAGMSPEEYRERLDSKYKEHAQNFEGDPQSTTMLQESYMEKSAELMAAYTKERHVFTQAQNYAALQDAVAVDTDYLIQQRASGSVTEQEQMGIALSWAEMYDYDAQKIKYEGTGIPLPNEEIFKKVHTENIIAQLHAGNNQAYEAAKELGFITNLPRTTQDAIRTANNGYEKRTDMEGYQKYANLVTQAGQAKTEADVDVVIEAYKQNSLNKPNIFPANGLPAVQQKAVAALTKHRNAQQKALRKLQKDTEKEQTKHQAALTSRTEVLKSVEDRLVHGRDTTSTLSNTKVKLMPNKQSVMYDNALTTARMNGSAGNAGVNFVEVMDDDPINIANRLKEDPIAALNVAQARKGDTRITKPVKMMIETGYTELLLGGTLSNGSDLRVPDNPNSPNFDPERKGQLSPEGNMLLNNIYTMEKFNPGIVAEVLGKDDWMKLEAFKYSVERQQPLTDIQAMLADSGIGTSPADFAVFGTGKTGKRVRVSNNKRDWLREKLKSTATVDGKQVKYTPAESTLTEFQHDYDVMFEVLKDQNAALAAVRKSWAADNVVADGRMIFGGRTLERRMQEWVKEEPELSAGTASTFVANDVTIDPEAQTIPHEWSTLEDLFAYVQKETLEGESLLLSLGVEKPPGANKYPANALTRSNISFEVDDVNQRIVLTGTGTNVRSVPISYNDIKRWQKMRSERVYIEEQRELIMQKTRVAVGKEAKIPGPDALKSL